MLKLVPRFIFFIAFVIAIETPTVAEDRPIQSLTSAMDDSSLRNLKQAGALPQAKLMQSFDLGTLFGNIFSPMPLASPEAKCAFASEPEEIVNFTGTTAFTRERIARTEKATVLLRFTSADRMLEILKRITGASKVDLNDMSYLADKGECTGTLITRNIVLTAGHCVSPRYFADYQNVQTPMIWFGNKWRHITRSEMALLYEVEANYRLANVASEQTDQSGLLALRPRARVTERIASAYQEATTTPTPDFALLRVDFEISVGQQLSLGLNRLSYAVPKSGAPLAIIQHPDGETKQIAIGTAARATAERIYYRNISTVGGSSGAGIYGANGSLLGVHVEGGCATPNDWHNKGLPLKNIKPYISGLSK